MKSLPLLVSTLILAPVSLAQISYHTSGNEFRKVDHQTNIATVFTGPSGVTGLNCLYMTSTVTGFIATVTAPTKIYSIIVTGNTVTLGNSGNALNTDATAGGNIAQVVPFAGFLYFTTQGGTGGGVLARIPIAGGKVQERLDLGKLTSPTAAGLANACTKVGVKIYVCTFNSGSTGAANNEIVEHDPLGAAGNGKVLMDLPRSKYQSTATTRYGIGSVNAQEHMIGTKPHLAVIGVFGDVLIYDVTQTPPKLISHEFSGRRRTATTSFNNLLNSGHFDYTTNSWVLGSRTAGAVERMASGHTADQMIPKPSSSPTSSISGTWFFPAAGNDDKSVGAAGKEFSDCAGTNGHRITDASMGPAVSPNPNFAFALYGGTGTDVAFLAFGVSLPPVQVLGCDLRINPLALFATTLVGGRAVIKVPIPSNVKVTDLYRQWASGGVGPFVLSNVRKLTIK